MTRTGHKGVNRNPSHSVQIPQKAHGVTLIELIVVLGILGILVLGTQLWLMTQLPTWRLEGAVRQVVSDLASAKMKAVVARHRLKIFFPDDHQYMILEDRNNNGRRDSGEKTKTLDIHERYQGVTLSANNNPSFLPRGTAYNFGSIRLSNVSGTRIITIGITGRIKVRTG